MPPVTSLCRVCRYRSYVLEQKRQGAGGAAQRTFAVAKSENFRVQPVHHSLALRRLKLLCPSN